LCNNKLSKINHKDKNFMQFKDYKNIFSRKHTCDRGNLSRGYATFRYVTMLNKNIAALTKLRTMKQSGETSGCSNDD